MFDVRPGVTGWAQVNGRKGVEWHKRIEMNVWYTEHVSFSLDAKILFIGWFSLLWLRPIRYCICLWLINL